MKYHHSQSENHLQSGSIFQPAMLVYQSVGFWENISLPTKELARVLISISIIYRTKSVGAHPWDRQNIAGRVKGLSLYNFILLP